MEDLFDTSSPVLSIFDTVSIYLCSYNVIHQVALPWQKCVKSFGRSHKMPKLHHS